MRENGGNIYFVCLEAQTLTLKPDCFWAKKQSSFKSFFTTPLRRRHCLATIAFILDTDLQWFKRILWRFSHNYVEPTFSSVISH